MRNRNDRYENVKLVWTPKVNIKGVTAKENVVKHYPLEEEKEGLNIPKRKMKTL